MTPIYKDALLGVTRHILTAGGGALVTRGLIDAAGAEALTGAVITIIGVVLSILNKKDKAHG